MSTPTARDVLVIGESIMDLIDEDDTVHEVPGGSAANVALGLGRFGVSVDFLTCLAPDRHGRAISAHLEESGVAILPESVNAPRTSTATSTLDAHGHAHYEFDVMWNLEPQHHRRRPTVLHVGSIAAFTPFDPSAIHRTMQRMDGREVTFDPNIRPSLVGEWQDELPRFESTASLATTIKLSEEDALWLYPDLIPAEVANRILGLGPNLVVVTLGEAGSLVAAKSFEIYQAAVPVPAVVDTIGAGDTYMAAMVLFLLTHPSSSMDAPAASEMAQFASRAAAITVSRRGADMPSISDMAPGPQP